METPVKLSKEQVAEICYEACRTLARKQGDLSRVHWHDASDMIREPYIDMVSQCLTMGCPEYKRTSSDKLFCSIVHALADIIEEETEHATR